MKKLLIFSLALIILSITFCSSEVEKKEKLSVNPRTVELFYAVSIASREQRDEILKKYNLDTESNEVKALEREIEMLKTDEDIWEDFLDAVVRLDSKNIKFSSNGKNS